MQRECERCGREFVAQRSTRRYCSSSCRGQATLDRQRLAGHTEKVVDLPKPATPPSPQGGGALLAIVKERLAKAERLDTVAGQQAVSLAGRMENSALDTGSAFASLSKELDRMMGVALENVDEEVDELDEIQSTVVELRTRRSG